MSMRGDGADAARVAREAHRILVVDDEEGPRGSLAANLKLEGHEVIEAHDGWEAIELAQQSHFDLMITDMRMPGLDGLDTFRELRKIQPGIVVVIMTAFTEEQRVDDALSEGAYAVVRKPFDPVRLFALIMDALGRAIARTSGDSAKAKVSDGRG
jgi:two-component system, NtrC family, response regulator HydG